MKRIVLIFSVLTLFFGSRAFGQTYTAGNLQVQVALKHPCNAPANNNGTIEFTILSSENGDDVSIIRFAPSGGPFTVANGDTFVFPAGGAGTYRFIISDGPNAVDLFSTPLVLSVVPPITDNGSSKVDNTVCGATAGSITLNVTGGGAGVYSYAWADGPTTQNRTNLLSGTYSVVVSNSASNCTLSLSFDVKDPQPLDFNIATSTPVVCDGDDILITVPNSEVGVTFQPQVEGTDVLAPQVGNGGTLTFTLPSSSYTSGDDIRVRATLAPCLPKLSTNTLQVTVNPVPEYTSYNNDNFPGGICSDDVIAVHLGTLKDPSSVAATSFNITSIASAGLTISGGAPATGNGLAANVIVDDRWNNITSGPLNVVYTIVPVTGTCPGDPFTVTVTINPEPDYNDYDNDAFPGGICSEDVLGVDLASLKKPTSIAATAYNITNIVSTGLTIAGGAPATGNGLAANVIADDAWKNVTNNPIDVVYTVVPVADGCEGEEFTVTVTINPQPDYNNYDNDASPTGICSGDALAVDLGTLKKGSSAMATAYNITNIVSTGLAIAGGAPATGNGLAANVIADDEWRNVTLNPIDVVYTIVPLIGTCEGEEFTVTVTINPQPDYNNYDNDAFPLGICSEDVLGINLNTLQKATSVAAVTYNITNIVSTGLTIAGGTPATGNGLAANVIADDAWKNVTNAPIDVVYTIVPVGACTGDPFTVTVTVNPQPDYNDYDNDNAPAGTCSEAALGIDLGTLAKATSGIASTYNITNIVSTGLTIAGGAPATGNGLAPTVIANDAWKNITNNPIDVVYTIVPVIGTCEGEEFTVTVTINPQPDFNNYNNNNNPSGICSRDALGINLATLQKGTSIAAATYNITNIAPGALTIAGGAPATGNGLAANIIADDEWRNVTNNPVDVVYTIVPVSVDGCEGDPFTVTVTIKPQPDFNDYDNDAFPLGICSEDPLGINLNTLRKGTSIAAASYNITNIASGALVISAGAPATGNGLAANVIANDAWENTTNAPIDVVYTIVPVSADGCEGEPFTVTVTINPTPDYNNYNNNLAPTGTCSREALGIDLSTLRKVTSVVATTYDITNIVSTGLTIAGGAPATGTGLAANVIADDEWRNITNAPINVVYTIVPVTGTCEGNSFTVTVTINPQPDFNNYDNNSDPAGICSRDALGIDLSTLQKATSIGAATYNITNIASGALTIAGGAPATGNGLAANVIADDEWRNVTNAPIDVVYTIVPVSTDGCEGDPFTVTVTINPQPDFNDYDNDNAALGICSKDPLAINLNSLRKGTSIAAATYNITNIASGALVISAGAPATGNGLAANVIANDAWENTTNAPIDVVYTIVPVSADGCEGDPFTVTVTINPIPDYNNYNNNASPTGICSEDALAIDLATLKKATSVAATTYDITGIVSTGLTIAGGAPATGTGFAANVIADDAWKNITNAPIDVVYTIVPVTGDCEGAAFTVRVTIKPQPDFDNYDNDNAPLGTCSEDPLGIDLSTLQKGTSIAAATYNITNIASGALVISAGTPATGNGLAANVIADDAWENTTNNPIDVVYTVVPVSADGCEGDEFTVTVTINPFPDYNNYINNNAPTGTCSSEALNIDLSTLKKPASVAATTYDITNIAPAAGLTIAGGAPATGTGFLADVIANDEWKNVTLNPLNVVYTVVPVTGTCEGNPFTVTVTINPQPDFNNYDNDNAPAGTCSKDPLAIDLSTLQKGTSIAAATYNITNIASTGLSIEAGAPATGTGLAANVIADDAWENTTNNPIDVIYTIRPVSVDGCEGDPFTVTVTINPQPDYDNYDNDNALLGICSEVALSIDLSTLQKATSVAATSFNITNIASGALVIAGGTPATGNGLAANVIADDAWENTTNNPIDVVYTIVPVIGGCEGDPFTVTVTINPFPDYNNYDNDAAPAGVCSKVALGVDLSTLKKVSSVAATTYNITNISSGALTATGGIPATGTGFLADAIADDEWENVTTNPIDVAYTIVPVTGTCEGNPFTVTVTINPQPDYDDYDNDNEPLGTCSGDALGIDLSTLQGATSVAALTYNITNIASAGLTAGGGSPGTGNGLAANVIADDEWLNSTNNPLDVVYTIVPVIGTCDGDPFTVTVTINPFPDYNDYDNDNATLGICSEDALAIDLDALKKASSVAATTYNITNIASAGLNIAGGTPATGTGFAADVIANDQWENVTLNPLDVVYTIVPVRGTCEGTAFTVTVTINPQPDYNDYDNDNAPGGVCSNNLLNTTPLNINLDALKKPTSVAATSYNITSIVSTGLTEEGGAPTTGIGFPANEIANDLWKNRTANPIDVVYTIVPVTAGSTCEGDPFTVTVTINPQPDYNVWNLEQDKCTETPLGIDLSTLQKATSVVATSFNITGIQVLPAGGLTIVGGAPAIGTGFAANVIADDEWQNNTDGEVDVVYTIVPVANGCVGDPFFVRVAINPWPDYNDYDNDNAPLGTCSGEELGIDLQTLQKPTSVEAFAFEITNIVSTGLTAVGGSPSTGPSFGADELDDHAWENTTANPIDVVYTIIPIKNTCGELPFTVTVTILPQPDFDNYNNDNAPLGTCSGDALNIDLASLQKASSIAAATYNITNIVSTGLTDDGGSPATGNGLAANVIANDVWENTTDNPIDVVYTIVPVSADGCEGDAFTVTVTINPFPDYNDYDNDNDPAGVCSEGALGIDLDALKKAASVAATTYNIINIASGALVAGDGSPGTGTGLAANVIADDEWENPTTNPIDVVYTIVPVRGTCEGPAFTVTVTIVPAPAYNDYDNDNAPLGICSEDVLGINLNSLKKPASVAATTFSITSIVSGALTIEAGAPATGTGFAANVIANDAWKNTTNAPIDVVYTIEPVTGGASCSGGSFTVTVTINPQPDYNNYDNDALPDGICSEEAINIDLSTLEKTTSIAAVSYNITNIVSTGLTAHGGTPATGNGLAANVIADDEWTNATPNPIDVVYTVVPVSADGCEGDEFTVTVTINPFPDYDDYDNDDFSAGLCSELPLGIDLALLKKTNSVAATTYNIISISSTGLTVAGGNPATGNGLAANVLADDAWKNISNAPIDVVYTIVPVVGSTLCEGNSFTVTVTINPQPDFNNYNNNNAPGGTCSRDALGINLGTLRKASSVAATTYNITNIASAGLTSIGGSPATGNGLAANVIADDRWSNTSAGPANVVYTIVPVSVDGCEGEEFTVTVTIKREPVPTIDKTDATCSGADDGEIEVTSVTGGVGPFEYSKDNGATFQSSNTFSDLLPDDYAIVVRGSDGCMSAPVIITVNSLMAILPTISKTDASCPGIDDGTIRIVGVTGGAAPYAYSKDNGLTYQALNEFTGLAGGTNHAILVRDANGCMSSVYSIIINYDITITASIAKTDASSCAGTNGSITITSPAGGVAPYEYSIDNGTSFQSSGTFSPLAQGSYQVVIRDANGCESLPATINVGTSSGILPVIAKVDASCNGLSDGSITVTGVTGGVAPYSYSKDNGVTFQTGSSFPNLAFGNYAIIVRDAALCVSSVATIAINNGRTIAATINKTDASSCAGTNGSITITSPTGGTGPYQYSIDDGATFQGSGTFSPLAQGTYEVVVKDNTGCLSSSATINIGTVSGIVPVIAKADASCNGISDGSITVTGVTGGLPPYSYSKDNGVTFQAGSSFTNLAPGSYAIVVRDAALCVSSVATIAVNNGLTIAATINKTDASSCAGTNGSITITNPTGGAAPYQYSIDDGATFQASGTFSPLAQGTYEVVVKDNNGCLSATANIFIGPVSGILPVIAKVDASCNGISNGSITVTSVTGGLAPYSYSINNGASFQAGNSFPNLASGNYSIIVRDVALCVSSVYTIAINSGVTISASINKTDESCTPGGDGEIRITGPTGGTGPYQFSIDNGATFQASGTFDNLALGVYNVVIMDNNGCRSSATVTTISKPSNCNGGTGQCATVVINPEPSPAQCTLSNGGIIFHIRPFVPAVNNSGVKISIVGTSPTNQTISDTKYNDTIFAALPAGKYAYLIEYGDVACTKTGEVTIDQSGTVGTPVVTNITGPVCAGTATGSAILDVPGETGNMLEWSLDAGVTDPFKPFIAGGLITGIPAGPASASFTRVISVRKNASDPCYAAVRITIQDANPVIAATFNITAATCEGNDGAITDIAASGGSGSGYQFSIDGGVNFQSGTSFSNLTGGAYVLRVKDGLGCEKDFNINVTFPGFINATITQTNANCSNNATSGSLTVLITDPGAFKIALSTDQFDEPAEDDYKNYRGTTTSGETFTDLSRNRYFVYMKAVAAACPTRSAPINIGGAYALSFDMEPVCSGTDLSLSLTNVVGDPAGGFEVVVYEKFTNVEVKRITFSSVPVTGSIFLSGNDHAFLRTPDEYQIQMEQISPTAFCRITSPLKDFTTPQILNGPLARATKSFPDMPTGSIQFINFSGGTTAYDMRIELDSAASPALQFFETKWEEVTVNKDAQYEKIYRNVPPGRYVVQVIDSFGCSIEQIARVKLDDTIFVPNIFTPNDDGLNDVFSIRNLPSEGAKLVITSRWGKTVYTTESYKNDWKGENAVDGVYFYQLQIEDEEPRTGWVEVLRGQKP